MSIATDPVAAFNAAVKDRQAVGLNRGEAIRAVAKADPDLHRRYLSEFNRRQGRTHAAERLEAQAADEQRAQVLQGAEALAQTEAYRNLANVSSPPAASGDDVVTIRLSHTQIAALAKQGAELRWTISRADFDFCTRSGQPVGLSDREFRQVIAGVKAAAAAC